MLIHRVVSTGLVALVSFATAAVGILLFSAPFWGGLAFLYWRIVDPETRGGLGTERAAMTAGVGGTLGVVPALLLKVSATPYQDFAGVLLAVGAAWLVQYLADRSRVNLCARCRGAAGQGTQCPRCRDLICTRPDCWNAKYSRCSRCEELEIVLFRMNDEHWWASQFGRRVKTGTCLSCYKEAAEADLRECGQCHWPMCKRCWDYHNGVCQRCGWIVRDLPARLARFVRGRHQSGA